MSAPQPPTAAGTTAPQAASSDLPPASRASQASLAALGAGALALVLLFLVWPYQHWQFASRSSVLFGWFKTVTAQSEWIFCLVVPLIVGFLIYLRRQELARLPLHGSRWGIIPMLLGLAIYWMGYKVDTGYPAFIAAQSIVAGLILLLGGRRWMRALFFPWLFLAFMWPMFPLEERVAFPLRMFTAGFSAKFLNLVGIGVVREGTALHSAPDLARGLKQGDLFMLDVEEPCSGIRSLFSLMMISALYGYLALKRGKPRLLLFLSAIPLAILGNFVRMVLLAIGCLLFGSEFAVGRNIDGNQEMSLYHELCGYAVFAVALAGMFGISSMLERRHWRSLTRLGSSHAGRSSTPAGANVDPRRTWVNAGIALAVTLAGLGICAATDTSATMAEPGVELVMPLQMGAYQGREFDMTAQERNILDEGVRLKRTLYASASGRQILSTVIIGSASKRSLHRPEVCLPGQGWNITTRSQIPLILADGREVTATLLRMFRDFEPAPGQRMRMRALNIYWYIGSDGTTSPDYYDHIRIGYLDAVLKNLNHRWSMASFFVPLKEAEIGKEDPFAEVSALEDARQFIAELAPKFERASP